MPLPDPDEVHLWALDLARQPREAGGLLPSVDLRRADRIQGERNRARWVAARAGLRALLGGYLDADPAALALDEHAKPRLEPHSPLRFNLSHSGEVALVAVARDREVGADVEEVDRTRDVERLTRRVLLGSERAAVSEAANSDVAFFQHWVAKEAFVKATGRGIASLRSFEVALGGPEGPRLVHVGGDEREARRWSLHLIDVADPYVAALVVEGDARVAPLAVFEL